MSTPRAALLEEARLLEQLSGEWTVAHVAAFCMVSESFIYRSDCPRIDKEGGARSVKGKANIRFVPSKVREWNAGRTKKAAA